mmetsp:Transcript_11631/g.15767  ORF Transcript_11631/g.15767 Transcript_11631/m.15767 type:complete len:91 (-) Transcript_11631:78-350(-)|eukprot:CAMPEP_0170461582 /NCGR_PEP_ID=MMETSP0123-20130129/7426_1 /TAXON_ID=182087 /ORGANISM="Favella ehrenbergii, Strain Fehren 1" /LENGTH=90 /DNA_ID=CAMNT_0010726623 /DNA_START=1132 /DNA_END=1404 /DNA_ORIENTATION=-
MEYERFEQGSEHGHPEESKGLDEESKSCQPHRQQTVWDTRGECDSVRGSTVLQPHDQERILASEAGKEQGDTDEVEAGDPFGDYGSELDV